MSQQSNGQIKITNVPASLKQELKNIADHMGVELGSFLKPKLRDIANSYPEHMKQKPRDF
jgi:hypothetical protein